MLKDSTKVISEAFLLQPVSDYIRLNDFMIFKSLRSPKISTALKSVNGNIELQVVLVQYTWWVAGGKLQSGNAESFLGLLKFRKDYPATCIFKETLREKISDWFVKQDVDFEDQKRFSGQFHVVSKDKEKLQMLLLDKPLDELAQFPDIEVELKGNYCLFKFSNRWLSRGEAHGFVELSKTLHKIFS